MNQYIIKSPVITERSLDAAKNNCYTFIVDKRATKHQIKKAIESQFKVNVLSVRTMIKKGIVKRTGRRRLPKNTPDIKKAIAQVKEGQKIDVFETQG